MDNRKTVHHITIDSDVIRYIRDDDGVFWYFANDICKSAGFLNTSVALTRVPPDQVGRFEVPNKFKSDTFTTVSHLGLYPLLFKVNERALAKSSRLAVALSGAMGLAIADTAIVPAGDPFISPTTEPEQRVSFATAISNVFDYQGQKLRTATDGGGDIWFFAVDICRALGIQNASDAVTSVSEENKVVLKNRFHQALGIQEDNQVLSNNGTAILVDETGLYTLLFRSNKPKAKAVRQWVMSEMLPAIRKTGTYTDPAFVKPVTDYLPPCADKRNLLGFEALLISRTISNLVGDAPKPLQLTLSRRLHSDVRIFLQTDGRPWKKAFVDFGVDIQRITTMLKDGCCRYLELLPLVLTSSKTKKLPSPCPLVNDRSILLLGKRMFVPPEPSRRGYNASYIEGHVAQWSSRELSAPVSLPRAVVGRIANELGLKLNASLCTVVTERFANGKEYPVYRYQWEAVALILQTAESKGLFAQDRLPKGTDFQLDLCF